MDRSYTWTEVTDLGFPEVRLHDTYTWTEVTALGFVIVRLHDTYTWTETTDSEFPVVKLHDTYSHHSNGHSHTQATSRQINTTPNGYRDGEAVTMRWGKVEECLEMNGGK